MDYEEQKLNVEKKSLKYLWWKLVGFCCLCVLVLAAPFAYLFMLSVSHLSDLEE